MLTDSLILVIQLLLDGMLLLILILRLCDVALEYLFSQSGKGGQLTYLGISKYDNELVPPSTQVSIKDNVFRQGVIICKR